MHLLTEDDIIYKIINSIHGKVFNTDDSFDETKYFDDVLSYFKLVDSAASEVLPNARYLESEVDYPCVSSAHIALFGNFEVMIVYSDISTIGSFIDKLKNSTYFYINLYEEGRRGELRMFRYNEELPLDFILTEFALKK